MSSIPLTSHGYAFETGPEYFGELHSSQDIVNDPAALRERIGREGYLYLPKLLDTGKVLAARRAILEELDALGEIDRNFPLMEAIASGRSRRGEVDSKALQRRLRTLPALLELCRQGNILDFYQKFLGGPVRPYDFIWLRTVSAGQATGCHIDWVYMGRGTRNLYTSWFPLGEVNRSEGSLVILEGSNRAIERLQGYAELDVDSPEYRQKEYKWGWFSRDPREVQQRLGGRWLTADFKPGDVMVFTSFTMHCSLDNNSSGERRRIRLSADTRYQLASEPVDPRWVGTEPPGHTPAFFEDQD